VGYRHTVDDALVFALVDQRLLAGVLPEVALSVAPITVVAYQSHAGKLRTSPDCPQGTPASGSAWAKAARVGQAR
jgi:hypothetical protein